MLNSCNQENSPSGVLGVASERLDASSLGWKNDFIQSIMNDCNIVSVRPAKEDSGLRDSLSPLRLFRGKSVTLDMTPAWMRSRKKAKDPEAVKSEAMKRADAPSRSGC